MPSHRVVAWLKGIMLACSILLGLGGCFWLGKWQPGRPHPEKSVSGPPVYVPDCENCHEAPVGEAYAQSRHATMGVRCGNATRREATRISRSRCRTARAGAAINPPTSR